MADINIDEGVAEELLETSTMSMDDDGEEEQESNYNPETNLEIDEDDNNPSSSPRQGNDERFSGQEEIEDSPTKLFELSELSAINKEAENLFTNDEEEQNDSYNILKNTKSKRKIKMEPTACVKTELESGDAILGLDTFDMEPDSYGNTTSSSTKKDKEKNANGEWACISCPFIADARTQLRRHRKETHSIDKRYTCDYCDFSCNRNDNMTKHLRKHPNAKPKPLKYLKHSSKLGQDSSQISQQAIMYRCNLCNAVKTQSNKKYHMEKVCPNADFEELRTINNIITNASNDDKSYLNISQGALCISTIDLEKLLNDSSSLDECPEEEDGNSQQQSMHVCSSCGKRFKSRDNERYHLTKVCPEGVFEKIRLVSLSKMENSDTNQTYLSLARQILYVSARDIRTLMGDDSSESTMITMDDPIQEEGDTQSSFSYKCTSCSKGFKSKAAETYHCKKVCPDGVLEKVKAHDSFTNIATSKNNSKDPLHKARKSRRISEGEKEIMKIQSQIDRDNIILSHKLSNVIGQLPTSYKSISENETNPVHSIWDTDTTQGTDLEDVSNEDELDMSKVSYNNVSTLFEPMVETSENLLEPIVDVQQEDKVFDDPLCWQCNRCGKRFKSKDAERYHCKKVCPDSALERIGTNTRSGSFRQDDKWSCNSCSYVAVKRDDLRAHRKTEHSKQYPNGFKKQEESEPASIVKLEMPIKKEVGYSSPNRIKNEINNANESHDESISEKMNKGTDVVKGLIDSFSREEDTIDINVNSHFLSQYSEKANISHNDDVSGKPIKERAEKKIDGKWACNKCPFTTMKRDDLRAHRKAAHSGGSYRRNQEGLNISSIQRVKVENNFESLKANKERKFSLDSYRSFSNLKTENSLNLLKLKRQSNSFIDSMHACSHCSYVALSTDALKRHSDLRHSEIKSNTCKHCFFRCAGSEEMRRHVALKHEDNTVRLARFRDMITIEPV